MTTEPTRNLGASDKADDFTPVGRRFVTVIGIDQYAHLPKLGNAVSDAVGVRQLFVEKLGFTSTADLFDADATNDAIGSLVEDRLRKLLEPDDALLLFFAGHGHTRIDKIGSNEVEIGFLVPVEAQLDKWSGLVEVNGLLEAIGKLPARHVLVILDACKSGIALGKAMQKFRGTVEYERDVSGRLSRKIMTSARRDQLALDSGPVAGHSLFTGTLIEGLNWGKADLDGNGIVTGSELGLFVQQQVGQYSDSKQTPDFGDFYFDDRGELVISLRDDSFDAVKARAFAALQRGAMVDFADRVEQATKAKPDSAETKYLRLRLALYVDALDEAFTLAEHLSGQHLAKGAIPLEDNDLWNLRIQLPYYRELLALPATGFDPAVEVLYGPSKDNLAPLTIDTVANRPGYRIPVGSYYGFRLSNPLNNPLHIYLLRIDTAGRLRFMTLWNDTKLLVGGLPPGNTVTSFSFATGVPGINQMNFFASPTMIPQLLAPPEVGTRGNIIEQTEFPAGVTTLKLLHVVMPKDGGKAD